MQSSVALNFCNTLNISFTLPVKKKIIYFCYLADKRISVAMLLFFKIKQSALKGEIALFSYHFLFFFIFLLYSQFYFYFILKKKYFFFFFFNIKEYKYIYSFIFKYKKMYFKKR